MGAELSLTDRDENERRDVLSRHPLDSECDAKRRQADEKPQGGDERRDMIPEVFFESLACAHERHVRTDGARVEKDPIVDDRGVYSDRATLQCNPRGRFQIERQGEILREVI